MKLNIENVGAFTVYCFTLCEVASFQINVSALPLFTDVGKSRDETLEFKDKPMAQTHDHRRPRRHVAYDKAWRPAMGMGFGCGEGDLQICSFDKCLWHNSSRRIN